MSLSIFKLALTLSYAYICNAYITYIEAKHPLKGEVLHSGFPWPMPQIWNKYPYIFTIDPHNLNLTTNARDCMIIEDVFSRAKALLTQMMRNDRKYNRSDNQILQSVSLEIAYHMNCNYVYPQQEDNEYYEIEIPTQSGVDAAIRSDTIWGAIRALETFTQLVYSDKSKNLIINATKISDWPRYMHRGVMLDTSRHFLPKNVLLANLDAMAYNKFNVFHWHIVDDQSFPMESKAFPDLTKKGAYSPKHVYSQTDMIEIIEYARYRGIRVIPEIDSPGHTKAIGKAYPNILTPCYGEGPNRPYTPNYPKHAEAEILNPIQNFTYEFMKVLFEEVRYLFPDDYIHLGMDEVYYDCWRSNPHIQRFMFDNGMTQINQIEQYYARKTLENVKNIGYKYIVWQDTVDNGVELDNDTVVEVWKEDYYHPGALNSNWKATVARIVKQGYRVIVSACWYLNYIGYGEDWEKYYRCDPRNFRGTEKEKSMVIGGEACLWGEYVDGTNALSRLWPRASAVAERLWSDPRKTDDINDARFRLDQQRCRMLQRGIPAQPLRNGFCGDYEWEMENEV